MLKAAKCVECKRSLPLGPGILKMKMPPREVTCPHCGLSMKSTFAYRATWLETVLWKIFIILSCFMGLIVTLVEDKTIVELLWMTPVYIVFLGLFCGYLAALLLAPLIQVLIDVIASTVRKFGP